MGDEAPTCLLEDDILNTNHELEWETSQTNPNTFSPPQVCTLNVNSLLTVRKQIKARKLIQKKLRRGFIVMLQDTRISTDEKFKSIHSWARENIKCHSRVFFTKSKAGGVGVIFPEKIYKEIINIDAISPNLMHITYRNMNDDITTLVNWYGRQKTTQTTLRQDLMQIKVIVNEIRKIHSLLTVVVAGDFNVQGRASNPKYSILIEEMSQLGLSHIAPLRQVTRQPFGKQSINKRPSKLDYIFTTELVRHTMNPGIERNNTQSDHFMLTLARKTKIEKPQPIFPDEALHNIQMKDKLEALIKNTIAYILRDKQFGQQNKLEDYWTIVDHELCEHAEKNDNEMSANTAFRFIIDTAIKGLDRDNRTRKKTQREKMKKLDEEIIEINDLIAGTECNSNEIRDLVEQKIKKQDEKQILTDQYEAKHNKRNLEKFWKEGDKSTSYHFKRNSNKKVGNGIEILRRHNGQFIINPDEIEEETVKYFEKQFTSTKKSNTTPLTGDEEIFKDTPKIANKSKKIIKGLPTINETKKAIDALKDKSAPGPDGCTAKFVKYLNEKLPRLMNKLYCEFFTGKKNLFNHRSIKVIEKPGKSSYLTLKSFRPISLISAVMKGFENIIYNRLLYAFTYDPQHSFDNFTENNYAYRKSSRCL